MALSNEGRAALLDRAIRLESRSFLEYLHHAAPPIDIRKHPAVAKGFEEIAREEDEIVQELADAIVDLGGHPSALGTYDLNYGAYNYVTAAHALKVLAEKLAKTLARFDEVLGEAKGDATIEPRLRAIRERKARHLARIHELREALKAPQPPADAAPAAH